MISFASARPQPTVAEKLAAQVVSTVRIRMTALTVIGALLALGGGIIYLTLINRVATTGFEIKTLEQRVSQLRDENRKLELEAANLQSLAVVQSATESLGLTEVAKIEYLPVTGAAVARK